MIDIPVASIGLGINFMLNPVGAFQALVPGSSPGRPTNKFNEL
jgi:hypothetical protein